jgi:hypothetical protein
MVEVRASAGSAVRCADGHVCARGAVADATGVEVEHQAVPGVRGARVEQRPATCKGELLAGRRPQDAVSVQVWSEGVHKATSRRCTQWPPKAAAT